ncbi:MAG: DUF4339 domain-containing protein [Opitutales bacterium]|jgi:hypothetical protein|nr:DUF4339 domain-containing protein [Opitutales bacterium]MDG2253549.1 GYF domain-containing protein [Opitutaceae bacterium]MBT5169068.1 DUF4339 domain-containing protein [Opitutales bacterium]MBT5816655.1 DUF4339 domain-containing protein [Opitutales bacterium]MBT6767412.1 DUF4339 domain-containing protein [Opitutales bacterium]
MREYYIRREGDEDAKGPYDIDQLSSLFEAGKVERDAYVYDIDQETWITIEECGELMKALFPEKKKLTLRSEESTPEDDDETSDESEEKKQSVSVSQMLAQAEGRDSDKPGGKSPIEKRAQAAFIGLRFATLFILGSAAAMIGLELDLVLAADFLKMMESPYLIFAVVDLILGFFLILQVTEVFPLVRFRAAIGLGTLSILFLASGDPWLAASNAVLAISTYLCTATLSLTRAAIPFGIFGTLGLAGYIVLVILPLVP